MDFYSACRLQNRRGIVLKILKMKEGLCDKSNCVQKMLLEEPMFQTITPITQNEHSWTKRPIEIIPPIQTIWDQFCHR